MKRTTGLPKKEDSFRGNFGGYTLIEALIVVAITSVIFFGVTTMFAGSRDNVDFNQAKADIDTKIKGYINEVSTGVFAGSTTHRCSVSSDSRAILTFVETGVAAGSNDKCTYLGKAILAHPGATKLYIYDVLGMRNRHEGGTLTNQPARSYLEARPEPAGCRSAPPANGCPHDSGNFTYLFIEEYILPAGLEVNYAQVGGTASSILKIYSRLEGGSGSSRGVLMMADDFAATASDVSSNRLRQCINEDSGVCADKLEIEANGWDLCVQNSGDSKRAKINIKPTSTGVVTKVTDGVC